MLPQLGDVMDWMTAFSVVTAGMAWWHPSDPKGDEVFDEATDALIEGVCDADDVGKTEEETWNNRRDQTSIEQIEKWREEQEYRRNRNRN